MRGKLKGFGRWNLSRGEWDALRLLRRDNTIVIKPANKGSMVVVMDREQYILQVGQSCWVVGVKAMEWRSLSVFTSTHFPSGM